MRSGGRLGRVAATATLLASAPLAAVFEGLSWLVQCIVVVSAVAGAAAAVAAAATIGDVALLLVIGGAVEALTATAGLALGLRRGGEARRRGAGRRARPGGPR